jgi:hypothetical protein
MKEAYENEDEDSDDQGQIELFQMGVVNDDNYNDTRNMGLIADLKDYVGDLYFENNTVKEIMFPFTQCVKIDGPDFKNDQDESYFYNHLFAFKGTLEGTLLIQNNTFE